MVPKFALWVTLAGSDPLLLLSTLRGVTPMHYGIVGMSESGKSTLGKIIAAGFAKKGVPVAVLDPLKYSDWKADFLTADSDEFLRFAKQNKSHLLIVDEGGQAIGRYNQEMEWLTTTSRHLGHSCIVISQGVTQLTPIIRGQFGRVFLFNCAISNWKLIAEEWNHPELLSLPRLDKGEFYEIPRFGSIRKGKVDFKRRKVKYLPLSGSPGSQNSVDETPAANTLP
jgi:hypothetical protein